MAQPNKRLVGNSFKLGYRLQSYWGTSMAIAFFAAELGTGTFLISLYFDYLLGMILGLAVAGTLKPYFHLTHMGVPQKSWRALLRPDRSWISRGAIAIGVLIGCGALYVVDRAVGVLPAQLASIVKILAVAAGLVVICYQGMAMSASESFTLWASPLVPAVSVSYALTAGSLTVLTIGWGALNAAQQAGLTQLLEALLLLDFALVAGILLFASNKSQGGAFSVEMLLKGELSGAFRNLVMLLGLVVPLVLLFVAGSQQMVVAAAWLAMLVGFYNFRTLMFQAAVYEPITHDLAGSIGLPRSR